MVALFNRGKIVLAGERLPSGVIPDGHKAGLENPDDLSGQAQMGIAPVGKTTGTVEMFLADIQTAGVTNFTVDDRNFAVVAISNSVQPVERRIRVHLDPASSHRPDVAET